MFTAFSPLTHPPFPSEMKPCRTDQLSQLGVAGSKGWGGRKKGGREGEGEREIRGDREFQ